MRKIKGKYKVIQIIGTQRSGSNLLRLMLNQLEEIVAPHPPHILKTFIPLLRIYGNLGDSANFKILIDDVCRLVEANPVPWQGVDLDRKRIFNLCNNNNLVEIFKVIYEIKAEAYGANFWCCKSMYNVYVADQLEFLDPFYIHLIRDGRDVAASFKKAIVGDKHSYFLAHQWKRDQISSDQLVKKKGPQRAIRIYYEDLLKNPEQVIRSICNLIEVTYNSKVMDFYHSKESNLTAIAGKMWKNLKKPIIRNNTNKYKNELSQADIGIFENVSGAVLRAYGYKANQLNRPANHYSEEQVEVFRIQNDLLQSQIKEQLKKDLLKRSKQEKIIKEISSRII